MPVGAHLFAGIESGSFRRFGDRLRRSVLATFPPPQAARTLRQREAHEQTLETGRMVFSSFPVVWWRGSWAVTHQRPVRAPESRLTARGSTRYSQTKCRQNRAAPSRSPPCRLRRSPQRRSRTTSAATKGAPTRCSHRWWELRPLFLRLVRSRGCHRRRRHEASSRLGDQWKSPRAALRVALIERLANPRLDPNWFVERSQTNRLAVDANRCVRIDLRQIHRRQLLRKVCDARLGLGSYGDVGVRRLAQKRTEVLHGRRALAERFLAEGDVEEQLRARENLVRLAVHSKSCRCLTGASSPVSLIEQFLRPQACRRRSVGVDRNTGIVLSERRR